MKQRSSLLRPAVAVSLLTATAVAQWVEIVDETSDHLSIAPISLTDTLEKDIAAGDLNGDGWDDVVVVRKVRFSNPGARTDILLINEDGVLVNRTAELAPGFLATPTDSRDVFLVDVDGDGWDDVVIANTFGQQPRLYRNQGVDVGGVWLGLADESFRLPTIFVAGPLQFCAVWADDVSGDGAPDIYFSNYTGGMSGATFDVLLINDGNGFFADETEARLRGPLGDYSAVAFGTAVEMRDVDNDGDNDLIKISTLFNVLPWGDTGVFLLFNDGAGFFNTRPFQAIAPQTDSYMFTAGDLTGDGLLDIFFQNDAADRYRYVTDPVADGPIGLSSALTVASSRLDGLGGNVKMADLDADGDLDVGVASVDTDIQNCDGSGASELSLLRNDDGVLVDVFELIPQPWHRRNFDFAFTDVDRDGLLDLFLGNCDGYQVHRQINPFNRDCNFNGVLDGLDIQNGTSEDLDGNGVPDECECDAPSRAVQPATVSAANRFLSIRAGDSGQRQAIQIRFTAMPDAYADLTGAVAWVGAPFNVSEIGGLNDETPPTFKAAPLTCEPLFADWSTEGTIHVFGRNLVPGGRYDVRLIGEGCSPILNANYSIPLSVATAKWGDVAGRNGADGSLIGPDGRIDVTTDAIAVINRFINDPAAPPKVRADINPELPDFVIDIVDVLRVIDAFVGLPFPFALDPAPPSGGPPCGP